MSIVAAVSLDEAGHPIHVKDTLARGWEVISDGLACFRAVAEVGCLHQPVVVNGRHPKDLPDFRWINTVIATWVPSVIGSIVASTWKRSRGESSRPPAITPQGPSDS